MKTLLGELEGPVPWIEIETRDELIAKTLHLETVTWEDRVTYAVRYGQDAVGFSHWERFGCDVVSEGEVLGFNARIHDWADLDDKFLMPDEIDRERLIENVRKGKEAIGDTGLALFVAHLLCMDPAMMDMGFENFCIKMYTDPALVKEILERYTEYYAKLDELYSSLPEIDFIWIGEDIAFNSGTYLRPEQFMDLIYPYFKRIISHIKKPWIYHSDGNIWGVMDEMLQLGMNGMHPFQPEAMDIHEAKKAIGEQVTVVGCVDLNTLGLGTPDDVEKETSTLLDRLSPGGRYILSSSNSLASWLKPENVIAMGQAKRRWNREHGFEF